MADKLNKTQLGDVIELNIGGTRFSTTITTLTSQKGSFFEAMFSGRWNTKAQKDGSYFIDRDPFVFRHILNFMRQQPLDLELLTTQEKKTLLLDANYYQLVNLVEILDNVPKIVEQHVFIPDSNYTLSNNNKTATKAGSGWLALTGSKRISNGSHQWTIKITSGGASGFLIGVAPFDINKNTADVYSQNGWYLYTYSSVLYSGPPMSFSAKAYSSTSKLAIGSTVTVKLDMDKKTIAFIINGTDYGVAYNNIPTDKELCSCVLMSAANDSVEIV